MRSRLPRRRYNAISIYPVLLLLLLLMYFAVLLLSYSRISNEKGTTNGEPGPGERGEEEKTLHKDYQHQSLLKEDMFLLRAHQILNGSQSIGKQLDIQLFVIWRNAYVHREAILHDIEKSFLVLDLAEFDWGSSPKEFQQFLDNLWVLYSGKGGWSKHGMVKKVKQCGLGKFIAIIVADMNPRYAEKRTAHGTDTVNVLMHKKKNLYRRWSGGGFRVHGTFSIQEANHDIRLLFHKTLEGVLRSAVKGRVYSHSLVSMYLNSPTRFTTRQVVYGANNSRIGLQKQVEEEQEQQKQQNHGTWRCASFLFALSSFTHVRVADWETNTVLWSRQSSSVGLPLKVEVEESMACTAWPKKLFIYVPTLEMWGMVALLRVVPLSVETVTLDSDFTIGLEGSLRVLKFKVYN
ncbi:hypothetical protein LSM04_006483 [Trypanosoma melophagium]|uniref:uncharacterized protein n=1 Tax=Trypanosoma melophagium TaxID=715481 RepID=UPI00351A08A3|nr:hypothetical protein LSM04_006483 [Trypanosoma melophagium]